MADEQDDTAAAAAAEKAAADAATAAGNDDDKQWDHERGMATITKLRDELKAAKAESRRAAELETRLKAIEDAEKTELQRAQDQLAAHEAEKAQWAAERRDIALKLAVHTKAGELGITSPTLALAALKDAGTVEYDDQGQPKNLDDALTALLEAEPALKGTVKPKPASVNAGDGGGGAPPPALTADQLAWATRLGMTPEQYAAYQTGGPTTLQDFQRIREKHAAGK